MANDIFVDSMQLYCALLCAKDKAKPVDAKKWTKDFVIEGNGDKLNIYYTDGYILVKHELETSEAFEKSFTIAVSPILLSMPLMKQLKYNAEHFQKSIVRSSEPTKFTIANLEALEGKVCNKLVDFYNNSLGKLPNKQKEMCKNGYTWNPNVLYSLANIVNIMDEETTWHFNEDSNEHPCYVESKEGTLRAFIMPLAKEEEQSTVIDEFDDI